MFQKIAIFRKAYVVETTLIQVYRLQPENVSENRLYHRFFPANFVKLLTILSFLSDNCDQQVPEATTSTARQYLTNTNRRVFLNAITYDAHHCQ